MASDLMPLMRASVIQGNLAEVRRFDPQRRQRIEAELPAYVLEAIDRAKRRAWLPLEHDLELTNAVSVVLGRAGCVAWARTSMLVSLRTPLLEPLWKAAFRVFGISPGALFRAVGSGWKAVYRNVGRVEHQSRPHGAEIVLAKLPSALLAHEVYLEALCGTFSSLLEIAETPGTVELLGIDHRRRRATYRARWSAGNTA